MKYIVVALIMLASPALHAQDFELFSKLDSVMKVVEGNAIKVERHGSTSFVEDKHRFIMDTLYLSGITLSDPATTFIGAEKILFQDSNAVVVRWISTREVTQSQYVYFFSSLSSDEPTFHEHRGDTTYSIWGGRWPMLLAFVKSSGTMIFERNWVLPVAQLFTEKKPKKKKQ
jgi:hypothetical protein